MWLPGITYWIVFYNKYWCKWKEEINILELHRMVERIKNKNKNILQVWWFMINDEWEYACRLMRPLSSSLLNIPNRVCWCTSGNLHNSIFKFVIKQQLSISQINILLRIMFVFLKDRFERVKEERGWCGVSCISSKMIDISYFLSGKVILITWLWHQSRDPVKSRKINRHAYILVWTWPHPSRCSCYLIRCSLSER